MAVGVFAASATTASAEVRTLKLYNLHTKEKAEIVFKRNGKYDQSGLREANAFLRDWRRNEPTKMDPRLLDLVWEAYRASGSNGFINVICGYRAPATNSMLRSRSNGVAKKSQHMLGKAMDFYISGVPLKKLRDIGLQMQGGGVGYYPTSGSPFVHMDVGNVRHWPGISRQELARVFPNGKTLHVPSDGKPLPGYDQALASYKSRKSSGSPAIALASAGGSTSKSGGLLAAFFGGGADEEEDNNDVVAAAPAPKKAVVTASSKKNVPGIAIVAPQDANRAEVPQLAEEEAAPKQDTPETIIAALPARSVPLPGFAPRPKADVGAVSPDNVPFGTADAGLVQTASLAQEPADAPFAAAQATEGASKLASDDVAASGVPLPTWRPEHGMPSLVPQQQDKGSTLLALADSGQGTTATDAFSVLPATRPDDEVKTLLEQTAADEYQVAAVSLERSAFNDPAIDQASPRTAAIEMPSDPTGAIGGNVKTTRKEARATQQDLKPEPKTKIIAAEPKLARWALHSNDYVAKVSDATTAPRYAYNLVRTAPTEVYTNGFQSGDEMNNANRFTGTAVKFLSVARFQAK
ncbi:DUF882 domain-containing protein [Mesorhizobium sp. Root157]|uniref:DUF882 domain-containing protein n=1 Tax=Mesorhizobium sp. Root157 TaxID=1736477 RepID=UPI000A819874|nr:DUF882 domain-containing protein [Mesorhizobium sp. Root157]